MELVADGPPVKHPERAVFLPPRRAERCRDAIWSTLKANPGVVITIVDLIRDFDFPSSDMYRAARSLVRHGLIERSDVTWAEVADGKERTHHLIGVKFVPEWSPGSSRKW